MKIKPFKYPKGVENKFAKALEQMIAEIIAEYQKGTLDKLNKSDKRQFEDSNFAERFQALDERTRRSIIDRFSNDRISRLVAAILNPLARLTERQFEENFSQGISVQDIIKQGKLKTTEEALIAETQQWAIKLRDDTLAEFTANTLRSMVMGESFEKVVNEYKATGKQRKNHAKFVARNQLSTFNSLLNKRRMENIGIKKAKWITNIDGRERPSHKDRDDKEFLLSEGLGSSLDDKKLVPGIDYNCRCTMVAVFEE